MGQNLAEERVRCKRRLPLGSGSLVTTEGPLGASGRVRGGSGARAWPSLVARNIRSQVSNPNIASVGGVRGPFPLTWAARPPSVPPPPTWQPPAPRRSLGSSHTGAPPPFAGFKVFPAPAFPPSPSFFHFVARTLEPTPRQLLSPDSTPSALGDVTVDVPVAESTPPRRPPPSGTLPREPPAAPARAPAWLWALSLWPLSAPGCPCSASGLPCPASLGSIPAGRSSRLPMGSRRLPWSRNLSKPQRSQGSVWAALQREASRAAQSHRSPFPVCSPLGNRAAVSYKV